MLGTIIVNYKTDDRVIKYVNEELPKIKAPNKIVVVNNSCTAESNKRIAEGCGAYLAADPNRINIQADIFVLGIEENIGYARGNNTGAEFLLQYFKPKYLLFSNSDLFFHDDNVIDRLITRMDEIPDVGLIGPYIEEAVSGRRQNPSKFKPAWKLYIIPQLFYPFVPAKIRREWMSPTDPQSKEGYCDYLAGSIFLARTDAFVRAGMFDPQTFLYCEEPILTMRINQAGFRVYYDDKVKVIHEHSYTVKQLGLSWKVLKHFYQSNWHYQKNYRKLNAFELVLFDISCMVFIYVWYPLIIVYYSLKQKLYRRNGCIKR